VRRSLRLTGQALALCTALGAAGGARGEEADAKIRPPGPPAPPSGATWLGRMFALGHLAVTAAQRDAARAALAAAGTQVRPDPAPFRHVAELAQACLDGAPPPSLADVAYVGKARGVSLEQLTRECEMLRAQAQADAERTAALLAQRAQVIRPLLAADKLKIFDAEGEPDCTHCDGDAKKIAAAREWFYVRGPSGPLATYETLTFVFRGNKLVERRQRLAHEQP
jgi:hypothetical protein